MSRLLPEKSRSWAEIDLSALQKNVAGCRQLAGENSGLMAVVKANAYGHGLTEVVAALKENITHFGVANLSEAYQVRQAAGDNEAEVFILSPLTPGERTPAVADGFSVSVSSAEELSAFEKAAQLSGKKARLHLAVDTGMGRTGVAASGFPALLKQIRNSPDCLLEGIWSHLPSADEDSGFTRDQISRFSDLVKEEKNCLIHLANSAGLLGYRELPGITNMSRIGLALYGVSPVEKTTADLQAVLTWKTRVTLVRRIAENTSISYGRTFLSDQPMTVATLAVGYGDGYPRSLSRSDTDVLIGGSRCPVLGRVTMDQIVVDISRLKKEILPGEEAVLLGKQGDGIITAGELARKAGTIEWEIFTGITARVERFYL